MVESKALTVLVVVLDAMGKDTLERYLDVSDSNIHVPNLSRLGLGNILNVKHHHRIEPATTVDVALAAAPSSVWADSVMGHRELMGFIDPTNYQLFYDGFPKAFVDELALRTGHDVLYNKRAGGEQAIVDNHNEHIRTHGIILYASMCDPIAQIAAYEPVIPPERLYGIAQAAFEIAQEQGVNVTRVITRPYTTSDGEFVRTANRRDVVLQLPSGVTTFIDIARAHGVHTVSIGKPSDVINTVWDINRDVTGQLPLDLGFMYTGEKHKDKNPYSVREALAALNEARRTGQPTFILCNLPDTDSLFGHNRIVSGNLQALQAFDRAIPLLEAALPDNSFLFVTADHGMRDGGDYGYHSREPIPIVGRGYGGPRVRDALGIPTSASSYAVIGHLAAKIFGFGDEYLLKCGLKDSIRDN